MTRAGVQPPAEPPVGNGQDLTAAPEAAAELIPPSVMAQSLPDYVRGIWVRLRSGDSGLAPVILALIVIVVVFQGLNSKFLTAGNIINLFQQSAVFMMLGMAEVFVLLLGEIDLSAGFVGAVGGAMCVQLVQPVTTSWPWWAAIIVSLLATGLVGGAQGTMVTRLRIPSFIVTLAGLLIFNGVLLIVLAYGPFSGYPSLTGRGSNLRYVYDLMWGHVTPAAGWVSMVVIVAIFAVLMFGRDERRRRSGLVAPPRSITLIKVGFIAALGVVIVIICNINRANIGTLEGVPIFIYIVFGVLAVWTFVLGRMRFGRYIYAIGGNAEAARRAGVNVPMIRTWAFALAAMTAGIAGILYASLLGGMSNNVNGGELVLYAVAAAVIGGTSLMGGRGRMSHAVLGGLVIGAINNGLYLQNIQVQWQYIITGLVLLVAVVIDSMSRGRSTGMVRI